MPDNETVSQYFRPVSSYLVVKSKTKQGQYVAFYPNRPQAGLSRLSGQAEFIVDRRSIHSDNKGMPEVNNDKGDVSCVYKVVFARTDRRLKQIARLQLLEESSVLKIVRLADAPTVAYSLDDRQELLKPNSRLLLEGAAGFKPEQYRFDFVQSDVASRLLEHKAVWIVVRVTNVLPNTVGSLKLADVFAGLGFDEAGMRHYLYEEMTADGGMPLDLPPRSLFSAALAFYPFEPRSFKVYLD